MKIHDLKCEPTHFQESARGFKRFEVRRDDRGFEIGDSIRLREWLPGSETYTGLEMVARVNYILRGHAGLADGFVVLGVEV